MSLRYFGFCFFRRPPQERKHCRLPLHLLVVLDGEAFVAQCLCGEEALNEGAFLPRRHIPLHPCEVHLLGELKLEKILDHGRLLQLACHPNKRRGEAGEDATHLRHVARQTHVLSRRRLASVQKDAHDEAHYGEWLE